MPRCRKLVHGSVSYDDIGGFILRRRRPVLQGGEERRDAYVQRAVLAFKVAASDGLCSSNVAFRFRFYPTAPQEQLLAQHFGCVLFVYNRMLARRQHRHKDGLK